MGKNSKETPVRKKGKRNKDYEGFQYGPLRLERFGRMVRMSSDWKQGEYEKFIERLKKKRPELKRKIDEKIAELLNIIEQNDPFELLTTISSKNCFVDPEQYKETTHKGRECYVEYALSLVTAHDKHGFGKHATDEAIEKFGNLIAKIFDNFMWHQITEGAERRKDRVEEEMRFSSMIRHVFMRGDSFEEHHLDLIRYLFKPHDDFLSRHYGLITDKIIAGIQEIERQINESFNDMVIAVSSLKEHHEIFKKFIESAGFDSFSSIEECMEKFRALPEIQSREHEIEDFKQQIDRIPFEIQPRGAATDSFIRLFSLTLGENKEFLSFENAPAWPPNDSLIYAKPIIIHDGRAYCFMPQLLFRNLGNIIENWIRQKDEAYFHRTYQSSRASLLEEKAIGWFRKLLPAADAYGKLYYKVNENGTIKLAETDGIILYDNNLFILEAKAGILSLSACRGSLERMKKDASRLIGGAYSQALRTKQFIEAADKAAFEDNKGRVILTIQDKKKIDNIFLVNVTLASLGHLSTQLNSLKHLKLIHGKEWLWSVFINDLRVIAEILESPSEFLLFLKRRLIANDFPQFSSCDELDFLMFYLNEGLYFEDLDKKDLHHFTPYGYTESLDRYYDFLGGRVSSGKKPALRTAPGFKELVRNIEALGKEGFTTVTTTLLSFSGDTQKEIIDALNHINRRSKGDDKLHDVTFYFKQDGIGVTFFVGPNRLAKELNRIGDHCSLKQYQTKYEKWMAVLIDSNDGILSPFDFLIFQKKWEYDDQSEQLLKEFVKHKWEKSGLMGKRVGRNELCPCGSGFKYKKCCGR